MQWKLFAIAFLFIVPTSLLNAQDNPEVARLQGAWEVNSLIENGEVVSLKSVRETMIRDGVLTIEGNLMRFTNPVNNKKRELAFVLNSDQNPRTIDLTSTDKMGNKGIYMLDSNNLLLCLCAHDSNERPTIFASTPTSKSMLFSMRKLTGNTPIVPPVVTTSNTKPTPATTPVVPTSPMLTPATSDEQIRKILVGTWGHQDEERIETFTMNSDNTFSSTWTSKKFFPKLFKGEERCSGTWKLKDGVIIAYITSSTDDHIRNQVFSYRVSWYTTTEIALIDQKGRIHRDWKISP
ncbi:MAG: TIGR03067 domain-containing protein [Gemmataceae bacterium]|nr:TIGR03067 domain-containing protein [Gemmataceae bacterium]